VKRALRAAAAVGLSVTGYSIGPDGTLTVNTSKPDETKATDDFMVRLQKVRP